MSGHRPSSTPSKQNPVNRASEGSSIRKATSEIPFELRRSGRRKTLQIAVDPLGRVLVTAPLETTPVEIQRRVSKRAGWIRKQQHELSQLPAPIALKRWVAGETHYYLGRQYRIRLLRRQVREVRLVGRYFHVAVPAPREAAQVQRALLDWFRSHTRSALGRRFEACWAKARPLKVARPPLVVRTLEKRWGSCSASGRLLLNRELVKLPVTLVDYVILHEICHLAEMHHGPKFWRLLESVLPDWQHLRDRLKQFSPGI